MHRYGKFGLTIGVPILLVVIVWWLWPETLLAHGIGLITMLFFAVLLLREQRRLDVIGRYLAQLADADETNLPSVPRRRLPRSLSRLLLALRRRLRAQSRHTRAVATLAETIVNTLPDPLLTLDEGRRIVSANKAASLLLPGHVIGLDLSAALRQPEVLDAADAVLSGKVDVLSVEFHQSVPHDRQFEARLIALKGDLPDGVRLLLALYDLTERKRIEQMRVDFIANASHELKTPLAALSGFIETLQGPAREDPAARERFLAIMAGQASRMERLVGDLLSLSQIEMKAHERPDDPVDMNEVLRTVLDGLSPIIAEKEIRIENNAKDLPVIPGCRDELIQVVQNLMDNAIKYGGSAGRVRIDATKKENMLAFTIADHGPGIAPEHLPRLTERFYRVDSARSRELGGTGLGLSIVKHILNRHGGRLHIESEPGQGTAVTLCLPMASSTIEGMEIS